MSRYFVAVCVIGLAFWRAETSEDSGLRAIRPEAMAAHVRFLADDLLEGRGTGTRGFDLAARYVASQFEALGLEPAGVNRTFFQPIRLRSVMVVPESTSLKIISGAEPQTLVYGQDYTATGDPRREVSVVSGQIVFVGQAIVAPDFGIDDYHGIDVRGKIVAYVSGSPERLPPAERAHFGNARTKMETAASRGAVGAIRLTDAAVQQSNAPTLTWLDEDGLANSRRTEVRTIAVLSGAGIRKLFGLAFAELGKSTVLPASISMQVTSKYSEVRSPNVVALCRGVDARLSNEYVIYSAHLDHLGIGTPVNGDNIYNGATDNAGSIAALIEIARAFTQLDKRQRRSILFLAVTGEERGLLGSDYFAEYPTVPRSQIVANVNMDGLNLLFDFRNIVDIGGDHSSLGGVVKKAAAKLEVDVIPDPTPEQQFITRSDQYSFVRRGIPALFPRTGNQARDPKIDASNMEADRMRSRYHQPSDDLTRPLDFVAGANTAKFNFLLGYFISEDEARPKWNERDFFGRTFGNQ